MPGLGDDSAPLNLAMADLDEESEAQASIATTLIRLGEDFVSCARQYSRIIISEVYLPAQSKTIPPVNVGGVIGGEK